MPKKNKSLINSIPYNSLRAIRVVHILYASSVPIGVIAALLLVYYGFAPFLKDNTIIITIEISLSIISILFFITGFFRLQIQARGGSLPTTTNGLIFTLSQRLGYFLMISVSGLLTAWLGGIWPIWAAMFVLAAAGFILTYPTDNRLNDWLLMTRTTRKKKK